MVSLTGMINSGVRAVTEKRPEGAASKGVSANGVELSGGQGTPKAAVQVAQATETAPGGVSQPEAGATPATVRVEAVAERRAAGAWDKPALFALVRENTARAKALGVIERAAADLSDVSRRNYERLAAKRLDAQKDGGGPGLAGVSRASFYPVRAAIMRQAAVAAAQARSDCDAAQRAGDTEGAAAAALRAARAMDAIDAALAAERPESRAKRRTKRNDLPKDISESVSWQELVWSQSTPAPRPALALMWAGGLRPAEIESGVDVLLTADPTGKPLLVITVPGKKVTGTNGQPRRRLLVKADHPAGKALLSVMGGQQQVTIQRRAATIKDDMKALKARIQLPISAYSFRHQVSSNAKASDMPPEMVAAALGHASVRTQGRYGSVGQAQRGGGAILDAKGSRQVRDRTPTAGPPKSAPEKPVKPGPGH